MEADPDNKALRVQNPFQEMEQLLSDFFSNEQLTNDMTMVPSEDLIKMFEICLFLAEKIEVEKNQALAVAKKFGNLSKDLKLKNSDFKK